MKKILIILLTLLISIILWGFFIETKDFKVKEIAIKVNDLNENFNGFKIAQISDLLLGSTKSVEDLKKVVEQTNKLKPDLIVFTGDLVSNGYSLNKSEISTIKEELLKLDCTLYKYAVIGDNDEKIIDLYTEIMNESNFKILDNASTYIFYKDITPIKITGLTNVDHIKNSLEVIDNIETNLNIVFTHYPDFIDTISNEDIDIVISGHSLNGQIRIPFVGGTLTKTFAKKYIDSYYEVNETKLYVSSGLGTETINFRLFNKPEINLYRLEKNS